MDNSVPKDLNGDRVQDFNDYVVRFDAAASSSDAVYIVSVALGPQYMASLATSSNGMRHTSSFGFAVDGTKIDLTRSRLSSISSLILFATSVI